MTEYQRKMEELIKYRDYVWVKIIDAEINEDEGKLELLQDRLNTLENEMLNVVRKAEVL